jgi:histidine triad (HIT) family protein
MIFTMKCSSCLITLLLVILLQTTEAFGCAFCNPEVLHKQTVFESQNYWVLADYAPINYGHLLIVPKRHMERLDELDPSLGNELLSVYKRVSDAFKALLHCTDTNIIEKNGKAAGQSVPHVHFHVIPMQPARFQTMAHLRVFLRILFGSRPASNEELEKVVTLFRQHFNYQPNP